ncbi:hypothetical protein SO802_021855 [Lithocarpus litseifolius]|uniref:Uncharacterized protein n=1 Tax=Lithocarpus litseifolius TaxID=425828 RepID=A0AAW2CJ02_9ROSI
MVKVINNNCYFDNLDFVNAKLLRLCFIARTAIGEDGTAEKKKRKVLSLFYVEKNSKQEVCFLQQQASKQETSTQHQGKLQVSAAQRASQQQGVAQHAPQDQEKMQVNAGHSASQHQWKTRDAILSNEELEDLIESIPYHGKDYSFNSRDDATWSGSY